MSGLLAWVKRYQRVLLSGTMVLSFAAQASFIESTMGAAVVNDATATYFNPAALTLLKHSQLIALGSIASAHSLFSGEDIQAKTGFTQSGNASSNTHFFLPSLYMAKPVSDKLTLGLAIIANSFNKGIDEHSILRYDQSSSRVHSLDLVPAAGFKVNDVLSLGAALNLAYADFLLQPITGFPSLNIPDSQSRNECDATGLGGEFGLLLKPGKLTTIGFNYRSAITYQFSGKSIVDGNPGVTSNQYRFTFWTPARSVLSINRTVTPGWGVIGTVQRIQWDIFRNVTIQGIATQIGTRSLILDATVPYHLHNTWLLTLGTYYRMTPKWMIRVASSYNQSPENGRYQLSQGDSVIPGVSMSYEINKTLSVDGSYAHAFIQNDNIHIVGARSTINGVNKGARDSVSLKLIYNPA